MSQVFKAHVTQYLLPDGMKHCQVISLPVEVEAAYLEMMLHFCWFEAEILTTGQVSLTITCKDGDVDIEICPNDSSVTDRLIAMLKRAAWIKPEGCVKFLIIK